MKEQQRIDWYINVLIQKYEMMKDTANYQIEYIRLKGIVDDLKILKEHLR